MISSGQRQKQTAANEIQVQSKSYRPMMIYGKCCRVVYAKAHNSQQLFSKSFEHI